MLMLQDASGYGQNGFGICIPEPFFIRPIAPEREICNTFHTSLFGCTHPKSRPDDYIRKDISGTFLRLTCS